jgi:hypothetical protein
VIYVDAQDPVSVQFAEYIIVVKTINYRSCLSGDIDRFVADDLALCQVVLDKSILFDVAVQVNKPKVFFPFLKPEIYLCGFLKMAAWLSFGKDEHLWSLFC